MAMGCRFVQDSYRNPALVLSENSRGVPTRILQLTGSDFGRIAAAPPLVVEVAGPQAEWAAERVALLREQGKAPKPSVIYANGIRISVNESYHEDAGQSWEVEIRYVDPQDREHPRVFVPCRKDQEGARRIANAAYRIASTDASLSPLEIRTQATAR